MSEIEFQSCKTCHAKCVENFSAMQENAAKARLKGTVGAFETEYVRILPMVQKWLKFQDTDLPYVSGGDLKTAVWPDKGFSVSFIPKPSGSSIYLPPLVRKRK